MLLPLLRLIVLGVDGGLALRGLPEPEHGDVLRQLVPDFFADMT